VSSEDSTHQPEVIIVRASSIHVDELGRICYEAFKELNDRYRQPYDWPDIGSARRVIRMLVEDAGFYGITAVVNGQTAGSNFLSVMDPTAGLGPLTVECSMQGTGIGRSLMRAVLDHAAKLSIQSVRLQQDTLNVASLSLYASLGFEARQVSVFMTAAPSQSPDPRVRPLRVSDASAADALCLASYKTSRLHEIETLLTNGYRGFAREMDGALSGYFIVGKLGHGVAATEGDALALLTSAAHQLHPQPVCFHCPLSLGSLYRESLRLRFRAIKLMTLMSIGTYEPPSDVWLPSVLY
jgi:GNAT superfamily N-acetyltransferase